MNIDINTIQQVGKEIEPRFIVDTFNRPTLETIVLYLNNDPSFNGIMPGYSLKF
jgi:hypothetical protein